MTAFRKQLLTVYNRRLSLQIGQNKMKETIIEGKGEEWYEIVKFGRI